MIQPNEVTFLETQCNGFIGAGNFDIYKCKVNNELKALKLFRVCGSKDHIEAAIGAIQREHGNLEKLRKSPNVISLHGMVKHQSFYGVLMEYAPRGNLEDFVKSFKPSFSVRLKLLCDVAAGLNHLHHNVSKMQSICHNDLTPRNVVLDATFTAKICDFEGSDVILRSSRFGLSDSRLRQEILCYTMRYTAPELLKVLKGGEYQIERRRSMDVFSFSMVTHFMLTGLHPFSSINERNMSYEYLICNRPNISSIDHDFELLDDTKKLVQSVMELMEQCWDEEPDKRPKARVVYENLKGLQKHIDEQEWNNEITKMMEDNQIVSEEMNKFVLSFAQFCKKVDNPSCHEYMEYGEQQQDGRPIPEATSPAVDERIIQLQNHSINAEPDETIILRTNTEEVECKVTRVKQKKAKDQN